MQNYNYKVEEKEIILSQEEHDIIKANIAKGKTIIYLRDNGLIINTSFIRHAVKTDKLTEVQEDKKNDVLKLAGETLYETPEEFYDQYGRYTPRSYTEKKPEHKTREWQPLYLCEFRTKWKLPHFENCPCKKPVDSGDKTGLDKRTNEE